MRTAMTGMFLCVLGAGIGAIQAQGVPAKAATRALVAVFAHPDDETIVGPLLAHYAAEAGTNVHLVILTNGDKGVTPFAGVPGGPELAAVRRKEAECSAAALGAEKPVLLDFPDGGLSSNRVLAEATAALTSALRDLQPDAIVTWGPDGGYGHPDHRLVSALVTEIVQAGVVPATLHYAGLPKSRLEAQDMQSLRFPAPFAPVLDELLTTRVPYTAADAERARASLACHASQFTPEAMKLISTLTERIHDGVMHLRPWSGGPTRSDVFDR